jgi:hypothetical protein
MTHKPTGRKGPRPHARGARPHLWKTGPDPVLHKKYRVWLQQRNQAQFRGEGWRFSFARWLVIWEPYWHARGRELGCMCMTRIRTDRAWTAANVEIITREEHARRQGLMQAAGLRSQAQERRRRRLGLPA